jgi:hypothetical protein
LIFPAAPRRARPLPTARGAAAGRARWRLSLVAGGKRTPAGITGRWTDEATLEIDYNTVAGINAYTIAARYAGDSRN